VTIAIREGPGFPRICKGSHKAGTLGPPSFSSTDQGSVTVFNADIAREDPPVQGVGGAAILLLY
jgi:hypothetical protein